MVRGMSECVKQAAPTVDKEALKKYSADKIAECGASVVTSDEFGSKLDVYKRQTLAGAH